MVESVRLQLIIGEDFTKSLIALHTDLEASCEVLVSDIAKTLNLHPNDPASLQVKTTLKKSQWATSLKVNLPLMELETAWEDMEKFLQSCLNEISSQTESRELIKVLSQKLSAHASRVRELVQVPKFAEPEVSHQVIVGLVMDQPLKATFFPGIFKGLAGRLSLMPPGVTDPPTSARAGVSWWWAAALREAVRRMEGRDINLEQVTRTVVPPGLHLDYDLDFQTRRVADIAPTLTSPVLSCLIGNNHQLEKPEIPGKPTPFKVDEGLWGHGWAPPKPRCNGSISQWWYSLQDASWWRGGPKKWAWWPRRELSGSTSFWAWPGVSSWYHHLGGWWKWPHHQGTSGCIYTKKWTSPKPKATSRGPKSMLVTSKEAGNTRSGEEEHTSVRSGSTHRGKGGRPPSKEVWNLRGRQKLGAPGEMQPPGVGDWNYTI